ncbi:hypothetical protein T01_5235 [Trichinella spiralis]|uniref:Uncharacterized protein n=1 Tax=Trichinella spiralis TaxID=6334 RepID=A0A0V0Z7S9_TRISP|nr:hypothetical protein T01_5235 [Trichinella spiralis]
MICKKNCIERLSPHLNSELQFRCLTFKRTSRWIILPDIATSMRYDSSYRTV